MKVRVALARLGVAALLACGAAGCTEGVTPDCSGDASGCMLPLEVEAAAEAGEADGGEDAPSDDAADAADASDALEAGATP